MDIRNLVATVDHLKAFSAEVLEAFQTGKGELGKVSGAVALRLLWREYEQQLLSFDRTPRPVCHLRLEHVDDLHVLYTLEACTLWQWSARVVGARTAEDKPVAYVTGIWLEKSTTLTPLDGLTGVVAKMRENGVEVRDYRLA